MRKEKRARARVEKRFKELEEKNRRLVNAIKGIVFSIGAFIVFSWDSIALMLTNTKFSTNYHPEIGFMQMIGIVFFSILALRRFVLALRKEE